MDRKLRIIIWGVLIITTLAIVLYTASGQIPNSNTDDTTFPIIDGRVEGDFNVTFERFSGGINNNPNPVRIQLGEDEISITPIAFNFDGTLDRNIGLSEIVVNGNEVTYPNQFRRPLTNTRLADLKYTFDGDILKEEFTLYENVCEPNTNEIVIISRLTKPVSMQVIEEEIVFPMTNEKAKQIRLIGRTKDIILPTPQHWDSWGNVITANYTILSQTSTNVLLEFRTPCSWLRNAYYPVHLDPTIATPSPRNALAMPMADKIVFIPDYFNATGTLFATNIDAVNRVRIFNSSDGNTWETQIVAFAAERPGIYLDVDGAGNPNHIIIYWKARNAIPNAFKFSYRAYSGGSWSASADIVNLGADTGEELLYISCEGVDGTIASITDICVYTRNIGGNYSSWYVLGTVLGWNVPATLDNNRSRGNYFADYCVSKSDGSIENIYWTTIGNSSMVLYDGLIGYFYETPITNWDNETTTSCATDEDGFVYVGFGNDSKGYVLKSKNYETNIVEVCPGNCSRFDIASNGNSIALGTEWNGLQHVFISDDFENWTSYLVPNSTAINGSSYGTFADSAFPIFNRLNETLRIAFSGKNGIPPSITVPYMYNETAIGNDPCIPDMMEDWNLNSTCDVRHRTINLGNYVLNVQANNGFLNITNSTINASVFNFQGSFPLQLFDNSNFI